MCDAIPKLTINRSWMSEPGTVGNSRSWHIDWANVSLRLYSSMEIAGPVLGVPLLPIIDSIPHAILNASPSTRSEAESLCTGLTSC